MINSSLCFQIGAFCDEHWTAMKRDVTFSESNEKFITSVYEDYVIFVFIFMFRFEVIRRIYIVMWLSKVFQFKAEHCRVLWMVKFLLCKYHYHSILFLKNARINPTKPISETRSTYHISLFACCITNS